MTRARATQAGVAAAALLVLVVILPAVLSPYWVRVAQAITIYSVVAAGLAILYGRVGMISLCQIALLGVGGWVSASARLRHRAPPFR